MKNSDNKFLRSGSIFLLKNLWELSKSKIESLVQDASKNMTSKEQQWINDSKRDLERVIVTLITDEDYEKNELDHIFSELVGNLHHVFKKLYNSLVGNQARAEWVPNPGQSNNPPSWFIDKTFLKLVADGMNLRDSKDVKYGYLSIVEVIRYLRNIGEHHDEHPEGELPLDHITGVHSCGNIYTLMGILILSIYAYIETLELWVKVN